MNKKKKIKNVDVKVIHVPHFDGLTLDTMLGFAQQHPQISQYLPAIQREIEKMPRHYIANVIYTVVGDAFQDWVSEQIDARNEKIKAEQDIMIEMDPEYAAIFKASQSISGEQLQSSHNTLSFQQSTKAIASSC